MRRLLLSLLPKAWRRALAEASTLEPSQRAAYLSRLLRRMVSPRRPRLPAAPSAGPILFICHGNIIRSALAEAAFRRACGSAPDAWPTESAGLFAIDGHRPDPRAATAGAALGLDLGSHRARRLTEEMVRAAGLVVVMDRLNEADLLQRYPWAAAKLALLGEFTTAGEGRKDPVITDPYTGTSDDVAATARRIVASADALARDLRPTLS